MTPRPGFLDTIGAKRTGTYDGDGRALWRITEPLLYYSPGWKVWLMFPVGFITNYASVPRLPFVYAWCGDRVYEEPAGHDFPYTCHCALVVTLDDDFQIVGGPEIRPVTRKEADDLFLEMLLLRSKENPEAVDEATAYAMHAAVRLGGGQSWDDETNVPQPEHIRALIRHGTATELATA